MDVVTFIFLLRPSTAAALVNGGSAARKCLSLCSGGITLTHEASHCRTCLITDVEDGGGWTQRRASIRAGSVNSGRVVGLQWPKRSQRENVRSGRCLVFFLRLFLRFNVFFDAEKIGKKSTGVNKRDPCSSRILRGICFSFFHF